MAKARLSTLSLIFFIAGFNMAHAQYAEKTGVYLPNEDGECGSSEAFGAQTKDRKMSGVCVPLKTLLDENLRSYLTLAIVELTDPDRLQMLEKLEIQRRRPIEAYKVEVEDFDDDVFTLVDGSVLEKTGHSYVGYLSYQEEAILYQFLNQWNLCVDGDSHKVKIIKNGGRHYSRSSFSASFKEIEEMEECN